VLPTLVTVFVEHIFDSEGPYPGAVGFPGCFSFQLKQKTLIKEEKIATVSCSNHHKQVNKQDLFVLLKISCL